MDARKKASANLRQVDSSCCVTILNCALLFGAPKKRRGKERERYGREEKEQILLIQVGGSNEGHVAR